MASISLQELVKVYPNGTQAVKGVTLDIADGEFLALLGPSGCGKTTVLRSIAGLEDISGGTIRIGDRVVNGLPPGERDLAMVFQSYALYPHMTVRDNIGFSLAARHLDKAEINRRVNEAARVLALEQWLDRKPSQLSGGQRQRVAMGRAIVREPRAFLMDEPLSNLDAKLRVQMRAEISRIQRRIGVATLYVTHDQTEAMTMADRVAVMREGVLQQVAAPQELYDHPANLFVAAFVGSPAMNLYVASVHGVDGGIRLDIGTQALLVGELPEIRRYDNRQIVVGIRPEAFTLGSPAGNLSTLRATVELVEHLGYEQHLHFQLEGASTITDEVHGQALDATSESIGGATRAAGVARVGPHERIVANDVVDLGVDVHELLFFDRDSTEAIGHDRHEGTPGTAGGPTVAPSAESEAVNEQQSGESVTI